MRRIAYLFLAGISLLVAAISIAAAEKRPHYGGALHVMLQSAPDALELPANPAPIEYWDLAHTLSLIGDTLVKLDALDRPQPALAVAWQSDPSARHWQFRLRRNVKFHDGTEASPAAIAQILGAIHSDWKVSATSDLTSDLNSDSRSLSVECETPMPALLAELALPRNLLFKRTADSKNNHLPVGTGAFLVTEWQPGKLLKLAANEDSWAGRPFVDKIEIEFAKSLRDQALALELAKTDFIEVAPHTAEQAHGHATWSPAASSSLSSASSSSLPVELLALVFTANSKAQDPKLREALALAIDRKPIQSVLLKGAGEPAASLLPNWMTGYSALFSAQANPQRARTLTAESRTALNLSYGLGYDPRDPQAQLIAERIALNARDVGITLQLSLSGAQDLRLVRVPLPSPDPATSLAEAVRELGLPQPAVATASGGNFLGNLYQAERGLLGGYAVIPLFHLPIAMAASSRVRGWAPDRLGEWNGAEFSLADIWLADAWPPGGTRLQDERTDSPAKAGSQ